MNQSPATDARIQRSCIASHQPKARDGRFSCSALLVVALMAIPLGRSLYASEPAGAVAARATAPCQRGEGLSIATAARIALSEPLVQTAPLLPEPLLAHSSSAGPRNGQYGPALALVLGLFSLAALATLILSLRRGWGWKHGRAQTREQVTRDLALLDDTIRAEMKRYESLSRLGRGA